MSKNDATSATSSPTPVQVPSRYLPREHTTPSKTNEYKGPTFLSSRNPSETSKTIQQQNAQPQPPSARPITTKNNKKAMPTTMSLTTPWARKFIMSRPKDALLPIPREFLSDGFNLVRLAPIVDRTVANTVVAEREPAVVGTSNKNNGHISLYKAALRLILDEETDFSRANDKYNKHYNITSHSLTP